MSPPSPSEAQRLELRPKNARAGIWFPPHRNIFFFWKTSGESATQRACGSGAAPLVSAPLLGPRKLERWLSGRKHRTRNAAYLYGYRGFESHPLRHGSQLSEPNHSHDDQHAAAGVHNGTQLATDGAVTRLAQPKYLLLRNGTYYVRARVPADLVDQLGCHEIKRSLGVGRLIDARPLGQGVMMELRRAFDMIRADQPDVERCKTIIANCFRDLLAQADRPYQSRTTDPRLERYEQQTLSDDYLTALEKRIADNDPTDGLRQQASRYFEGVGVVIAPADQELIVHGFMRAIAEQQRLFQFRLREPLLPYEPVDDLARGTRLAPASSALTAMSIVDDRKSLGAVVQDYLDEKRVAHGLM
jgi:hypothetical protein